mmetsp:Transcript_52424/g.150291  ORF Transcript_52424/g.150291 Transcript_52424/m.150291 type:complete len:205 (+) Transcript_52424:68-682(+)|eukprot:CAMPEP_0177535758 /NCGR_PEP_ID=MMETSP0369-20130122/56756_1 /TAXON_ID=447022 ORGANISM="Scrippsiella hangoei-like, Strain SHHI-4" /NCGR_SAMPLE_ID=MMETSP0369 /ASSEMBLY_ACC=CAM_ASM_000364 /LENGTH=204 /DNA_ID=CAMNT_0019018007 /DNA_START=182 /DNA_END=796 /DNA_ORIENTATION=-
MVQVALLSLISARLVATSRIPVSLIEWQGCPDCTVYGDGLVNSGLKRGLGTILSMIAYFKEGSHPGIESDPSLHPWVACANNVTGDKDAEYWWYRVAMCANPGQTVESCIDSINMPADLVEPIRECTNDPSKSSKLVNDMHLYGNEFQRFPWPLRDGKACLPQPDTHGDDITPLIQVVCKLAGDSGISPLPPACDAVVEHSVVS